ncbi:MAG: DUF2851 family protein [Bacteroidota bacterium]|nr:DUF2851 family protein [Bacteroidota bacterium]
MKKLSLNESFICRIWEEQTGYSDLKTSRGEIVDVIDYGKKNCDAGPDYKDARVRIGNVTYTGSIEIHRSLDDWYLHNHEGDNKYNDLILHVVFYGDDLFEDKNKNIKVKKSRNIPTVILSDFLNSSIHDIWKRIINNPSPEFKLPCFPQNRSVPDVIVADWLQTLSGDRLVYKSERIQSRLNEITTDICGKIFWDQVLFEFICEALGFSKNKEQFLKLSKRIELDKIKKLKINTDETDSIIFGLSGFLAGIRFKDSYVSELKNNWSTIGAKLQKEIMDRSEWNFFRLRPANFPTRRLAYASALLNEILYNDFFKSVIKIFEESEDVSKNLQKALKIEISEYWRIHYDFGKESKLSYKTIGQERIKDITTNVLLPIVYLYSLIFDKINLQNRLEYFYSKEKQKSGSNEVTRVMENQINVKTYSLADEQALMQLHNFYCIRGKCNECGIGKIVFANDKVHEPLRIILY